MELNELRIFLAVAHAGGVTRAAEQLNYVQSNVTARIRQLEESLGVPLFHRRSRGMLLTSHGEQLRGYAERIVQLALEAEQAVREQGEVGGRLVIGSVESTAAVRLPELLAQYHQLYPQVELCLKTATSEETLQRLLDYQVDGAFVGFQASHPDLTTDKAFDEEVVLVTAQGTSVPEAQLKRTILVSRAGCAYRARLENWLKQSGQVPYRVMEFGSLEAILGCVAAGMGISFMPRSMVALLHYGSMVECHTLPPEIGDSTTWFVYRSNERESAAMRHFRELIPQHQDHASPTTKNNLTQ
jgi:DNA-binding transcriptional LysR family regulator